MIQLSHSWAYPKETKSVCQRDTCIPRFIAALCTLAKIQKHPKSQMSFDGLTDKEDVMIDR